MAFATALYVRDTALRLSKYFGNSAKFWLGLQDDYDLEEVVIRRAIHDYYLLELLLIMFVMLASLCSVRL